MKKIVKNRIRIFAGLGKKIISKISEKIFAKISV